MPSSARRNSKVPAEWYAGNYKLKVANQILSGATAVIFDASDLMPPAVGGGSFWTGISDWANNNGSNTDQVLADILAWLRAPPAIGADLDRASRAVPGTL